jgi:N-acetyl-gamma-glutamyl-phosphate reductase
MAKIFVDGQAGTTGLTIKQRLENRQDIELIELPETLRKDPNARREAIFAADAAFLCLPDAAAIEAVALAAGSDTILLDTSTAHRTAPGWAYGFPELGADFRENIRRRKRIAVPGCHASGFIALVYPLVQAGLLDRRAALHCFSLTGYSGGGKSMIAEYETGAVSTSQRQYGLSQEHKHLPEMQTICGLQTAPIFSPVVSNYYAGMEVTLQIGTAERTNNQSIQEIIACYQTHYKNADAVHYFAAAESYLASDALAGKDHMDISVFGNDERILCVARFDNLGKGSGGAAVQCLDLALQVSATNS